MSLLNRIQTKPARSTEIVVVVVALLLCRFLIERASLMKLAREREECFSLRNVLT